MASIKGSKKTIVVTGATGLQGGSVARTFLSSPQWHVRCLTRDPSSDAAQALAAKGAEVVAADITKPETLTKAFEHAHAIFLNTELWTVYRPAKAALDAQGKDPEEASHLGFAYETTNGKNAVLAAAAVPTLERFVYSSLPSVAKASGGKYTRSKHAEAKAWITEYIKNEQPELAKKTSFIYLGAYVANPLVHPARNPATGAYALMTPLLETSRMPIVNPAESTGPFVRELIENEKPGISLLAYDSYLTVTEIIQTWSSASKKDASYVHVSLQDMHDKFGLHWELLDALGAFVEGSYAAGLDEVVEPPQLRNKVETTSFEDWLKAKDWDKELAASSK